MARIQFHKTVHDFGEIDDHQTHTTTFPFTNTGNGILNITEVKAACGCTIPTLSKYQFMPGESSEIQITFDPAGKTQTQNRKVTVLSNAQSDSAIELMVMAVITPLMRLESKFLTVNTLALNQQHTRRVTVYYKDRDLQITGIFINHPNITAKVIETGVVDSTFPDYYHGIIELTFASDTPWGQFYGVKLTISARGSVKPEVDPVDVDYFVMVQGRVFGDLVCKTSGRGNRGMLESGVISMGPLPMGSTYQKSATIERISGYPFSIRNVTVIEQTNLTATATVEPVDEHTWRLVIRGNAGNQIDIPMIGLVQLQTDVAGEEVLTVRFTGIAR